MKTIGLVVAAVLLAACSHAPQTPEDKVVQIASDAGITDTAGWTKTVKDNCALSALQLGLEGPLMKAKTPDGYDTMLASMQVLCPTQAAEFGGQ